jgi:hypothetical protein
MPHSLASDKWLSPLQLARLDPPAAHCMPMLALTRRLSAVPKHAPHWSHVFTTLMRAYVVVVTDGEPTLLPGQVVRKPTQLWELTQKWMVSYAQSCSGGDRKYEIASRIISDILDWSEEVIETRKETRQGWFSGKAFTSLMESWIDLSRKVRMFSRSLLIPPGSCSSICVSSCIIDIRQQLAKPSKCFFGYRNGAGIVYGRSQGKSRKDIWTIDSGRGSS